MRQLIFRHLSVHKTPANKALQKKMIFALIVQFLNLNAWYLRTILSNSSTVARNYVKSYHPYVGENCSHNEMKHKNRVRDAGNHSRVAATPKKHCHQVQ